MMPLQNNLSSLHTSPLQQQQVYTDLNQLQAIRHYGDRDKSHALMAVAKQFESIFMQTLLSSMRSANAVFAKDNFLNSFEMDFHRDMLDKQLTLSLSGGSHATQQGLGLAAVLYRQLTQNYAPETAAADPGEFSHRQAMAQDNSNNNPYGQPLSSVKQRAVDAQQLSRLQTPDDFIAMAAPYAQAIAADLGVDYRVLVAQSALETGWGQHVLNDSLGQSSFNLFNIKADQRWQGKQVTAATLEYSHGLPQQQRAHFRRYASIAESFADYVQFLQQPRYQQALASADNAPLFLQELQRAGYATDPRYAEKIHHIVQRHLTPDDLAQGNLTQDNLTQDNLTQDNAAQNPDAGVRP
ncbi:MAG: flagellar assembly peptidoglycan hydrolase FlgJ [Cellvibrionaceae bacterium]|nr:flagellar assembly peptidoglycan hydrolase FlgJ [Cellvibrionaceae bacterium]